MFLRPFLEFLRDDMMAYAADRYAAPPVEAEKTVFQDGSFFHGRIVDGLKHGNGFFVSAAGARYTACWEWGAVVGQCSITFPNGSHFSGSLRDGKAHGYCTLVSHAAVGESVDVIDWGATAGWQGVDIYEGWWEDGSCCVLLLLCAPIIPK